MDHYVIAFSGDLAASGKINEYRTARTIFPRIFSGIRKRGKNVGFIPLLMVPGNHDLTLPNPARDRQFIQEHYDNGTIEDILPTELKYLDNFYTYSDCKGQGKSFHSAKSNSLLTVYLVRARAKHYYHHLVHYEVPPCWSCPNLVVFVSEISTQLPKRYIGMSSRHADGGCFIV